MPVHSTLPEHRGENELARQLMAIDDGRLHLWFDLSLPGAANVDILLLDEFSGLFCIEVKAFPINAIEWISLEQIKIAGRSPAQNPVGQARRATYSLLEYLRQDGGETPWITGTVWWANIFRDEWREHWEETRLPRDYENRMLFKDECVSGIDTLRHRLRDIKDKPPWGEPKQIQYAFDPAHLEQLRDAFGGKAVASSQGSSPAGRWDAEPVTVESFSEDEEVGDFEECSADSRDAARPLPAISNQPKLDLGMESTLEVAENLLELSNDLQPYLAESEIRQLQSAVKEIVLRLKRPFKLGVIGEFRAGKSSLINVLLGEPVALTGEFETTFAYSRFYHSPERTAEIHYQDGNIRQHTIEQANDILREWMSNRAGANPFKQVDYGLPAPILEKIEIWDAPGLGGSDPNDQLARTFAEEIDAGIWVFNADYSGRADIQPVLQELRTRGKTVIGVVNKSEDVYPDEFDRIKDVLLTSYEGVPFACVLAFSARLASIPDFSRDPAGNFAVDAAGNLDSLIAAIRETIIRDPNRLSVQAATGDLRALLISLRESTRTEILAAKRKVWLGKTQLDRAAGIVDARLLEISGMLANKMDLSLRDDLIDKIESKLVELSDSDLRSSERVDALLRSILSDEYVEQFLAGFFESHRSWFESLFEELALANRDDLLARLTPAEKASIALRGMLDVQSCEQSSVLGDALTTGSVTGISLGALALLIPGPQWPFVLLGSIASFWATLSRREVPRLPAVRAEILQLRRGEIRTVVDEVLADLAAVIRDRVADSFRSIKQNLLQELKANIFRTVFEGESEASVVGRMRFLSQCEDRMNSLALIISDYLPSTALVPVSLRQPLALAAGNRKDAQETIRKIFAEARVSVSITDGALDPAAFPILLDIPQDVVIRILAWQVPASAAGNAFRISLAQLKEKRQGTVHVLSPIPLDDGSGTQDDVRPKGLWIFNHHRTYFFDAGLTQVFSADKDIRFVPYDDDGSLFEDNFSRWWDDRVPGYQVIRV